MGGLVSKDFIEQATYDDNAEFIKLFVSISTPWNGHPAARYGVEFSPATIPSWIDMVPESEYQQSLFVRKLKNNIDYYLFFGYRGRNGIIGENSDGTVSLSSMLKHAAQQEARKIYGFNEDHVSILSSDEVFDTYNNILKETDSKLSNQEYPPY
jgi:hypothetical protein